MVQQKKRIFIEILIFYYLFFIIYDEKCNFATNMQRIFQYECTI